MGNVVFIDVGKSLENSDLPPDVHQKFTSSMTQKIQAGHVHASDFLFDMYEILNKLKSENYSETDAW